MQRGAAYELVEIMRRLRSPEGCPWDREQTLESLKKYLVEECYETLDAIDDDDPAAHCDELGDLLLQIAFQSQLRSETGHFDFEVVAQGICDKMIRRHPHVFADAQADTSDEVLENWERIKARERGASAPRSALGDVPRALPALRRSQKIQARAARVGFDWPDAQGALLKLDEELAELREAMVSGGEDEVSEELGDLLFATVNVARLLGRDAEDTLDAAMRKFRARFETMEARILSGGRSLQTCTLDELEAEWSAVKEAHGE